MAITYSSDWSTQLDGIGASITSGALSCQVGDLITVVMSVADSPAITSASIANNNTAVSWTSIVVHSPASNCGFFAWRGVVTGTPPTTVTVTGTAGSALNRCKVLFTAVHTGAHAVTPVPAGNVFTGSSLTDASRSITPTSAGSALWMICGDWVPTNTFAAGANCTLDATFHEAGQATFCVVRPTTQPRPDGAAFTLSETDTAGTIAYVAFEVQAAPAQGPPTGSRAFEITADWKPQRWDFPLGVDLLLDDYLPSVGAPSGAIAGSATLTFTPAANITGLAAIAGASTLTFTPAANVTGNASVAGASTVTFTAAAAITGLASIAGASSLTFTPAGDITGTASMAGSTTITFTATGDISIGGGGSAAIAGGSSLTFASAGAITGTASLAGTSTVTFTAAGDITGTAALAGAATVTFTASGAISALAPIAGTATLTFTSSASLTGLASIEGASTLVFTPSGNIELGGSVSIAGSSTLTFTSSGNISIGDEQAASATPGFFYDYEEYRRRKRRELEERLERERETQEIQDETDRQIAELLRIQEAKDAQRAEIARLQRLVDRFANQNIDLPPHILESIRRASERRTFSTLERMAREIERMYEEMEAITIAVLLLDDD